MKVTKNIIILAVLFGFCAGCNTPEETRNYNQRYVTNYISIIVYDGCEYLAYNTGSPAGFLTHKGNCTNLIHKH